jgi:hypothetical protein
MTASDRDRLLANFNGNAPADASAIRQFETDFGVALPEDYARFLSDMNGGEGFIGDAYVILWSVETLIELNRSYQVADYAPGLLLIGSDGGGEAFAFDLRTDVKSIMSIPFVGTGLNAARPIAPTFEMFLRALVGP